MAEDSFSLLVREQLSALPCIKFRRMFGGQGLYLGETFFGILHRGRLYFKTDAASRMNYDDAGMGSFQPSTNQCLPAYREVPAGVLEDAGELCTWAQRAAMCQAANTTKRPGKRPSAQRRGTLAQKA